MLKFKIKIRNYFLLLLSCLPYLIFSQHHISKYEKNWAVFHPVTALKIKKELTKAMKIYGEVKNSKLFDTLENGGKLDAFRHTYTMAYLSRKIKPGKLRKLGEAHEKGDKLLFLKNKNEFGERPDSMACVMDLRNNELGFSVGLANKSASDEDLKQLIIKVILDGKAWYLRRNSKFQYVDCDENILNLSDYKGKWSIPKCLIATNK